MAVDLERLQSADRQIQTNVRQLATFHFILAASPRLMWLEREHKPGTCIAIDCEFVPPSLALRDGRYDKLMALFEEISERYTVQISDGPISTSATAAA